MNNIDKKNGDICFNENTHKYWDNSTKENFTSVTTLIHKFTQPFDEEFWSKYKAIERMVSPDTFKLYKKDILSSKKIKDSFIIDILELKLNDFNLEVSKIRKEWDDKKKGSCERGTAIHLEKELSFYSEDVRKIRSFKVGSKLEINGDFVCEKNNFDLSIQDGIFPEFLVYYRSSDGILKIAGQIDLLIKQGNDIYILDWKTNNELKFTSGFDFATKKNVMMLYPLNNLMDCNMSHYGMQLSTYAWMLQQINPNFNVKALTIVHIGHDNVTTYHDMQYLKSDVESMFSFFKKEVKHQMNKERRKKIEF